MEFTKRLDPDLPFYYYMSPGSRFYEGDSVLPGFNVEPSKQRQPKRAPRHELLGSSHCVTLAVRGAGSIRTQFHNIPVDFPPPSGTSNSVMCDHSYASARP